MTMQVVHVIESFSGGSLDVVRALTRVVRLPDGTAVKHIVIHGRREDSPADAHSGFSAGVEMLAWPSVGREINAFKDSLAGFSLFRILKQRGPVDVLHLHSSKAGFLGRLLAPLLGLKSSVIYTPHGVATIRKDIGDRKRRLYGILERLAAKGGEYVVACSPSERKAMALIGVPALLIPNGVPGVPARCQALKPRRIVNVGRITAAKDPAFFAEIACQSSALGLPYEFVWVGDGDLQALLLDAPVHVTGWLAPGQVTSTLSESDIYISTSLWEGLSLSTLQAMASGNALLLRQCPGNTDLLEEHAGAGFVSVAQALEQLVVWSGSGGEMLLEAAGISARRLFQEKYSESAMQAGYAELYGRIKDAHTGSSGH